MSKTNVVPFPTRQLCWWCREHPESDQRYAAGLCEACCERRAQL